MLDNNHQGVGKMPSQGSITLTQPRGPVPRTKHKEFERLFKEDFVSEMRVYSPSHLHEAQDHGIKFVFLVPTEMSRLQLHVSRSFFTLRNKRLESKRFLCPVFSLLKI